MTATATAARPRLDRRRVLEAALALVDREGLDALTMRRLGAELGVDPMTVHHHVENKDRLLDGLAELLWEEVAFPEDPGQPAEALRGLARSLRDLFRRHPQAAPLILRCSRRLPRSELELFRAYLDVLEAGGVREPAAVLRPVISYAAGYGYAERSMLGVQCEPPQPALSEREVLLYLGQALPPGTPPELASAAMAVLAECDADRCFEEGLDLMLAGLAASPGGSRKRRDRGRA